LEIYETKSPCHPKKIFIVHGHDGEAKQQLARMLTNFGLEPIILDERPDKGRTIIEKFEEEVSDIGYAFVLLTPDDKITISIDNDETDQPNTKKLNRARQNVVFEMGYFMGKRGRKRVCFIYKGVEKPSDIDGIVYKSYRNSVIDLFKPIRDELKSAGYQINEN
jgi:predicted nucleotide-binding protein